MNTAPPVVAAINDSLLSSVRLLFFQQTPKLPKTLSTTKPRSDTTPVAPSTFVRNNKRSAAAEAKREQREKRQQVLLVAFVCLIDVDGPAVLVGDNVVPLGLSADGREDGVLDVVGVQEREPQLLAETELADTCETIAPVRRVALALA